MRTTRPTREEQFKRVAEIGQRNARRYPTLSSDDVLEELEALDNQPKPQFQDRISQDPRVMVGKAVVKGTRIPVEQVIGHLASNFDLEDLFAAYPQLTIEDVKACLAYALDVVEAKSRRAVRKALKSSVADLAGAAGSLDKPMSWDEMREIAIEDHIKEKFPKPKK